MQAGIAHLCRKLPVVGAGENSVSGTVGQLEKTNYLQSHCNGLVAQHAFVPCIIQVSCNVLI